MRDSSVWSIVFSGWLLVSQMIMLAWAFRADFLFDKFDWGLGNVLQRGIVKLIGWSAFIGFGLAIYDGYNSFLWFLPSSFGFEDKIDGQITSVRSLIATLAAVVMASAIVLYLTGRNEKRREQLKKGKERKVAS